MTGAVVRWAAVVPVVLMLRGALTPTRPELPPRIPAPQAQAWMVDALPGIGPKRIPEVIRTVHEARPQDLPRECRAAALEVFLWSAPSSSW